jgi:hypothetical protein
LKSASVTLGFGPFAMRCPALILPLLVSFALFAHAASAAASAGAKVDFSAEIRPLIAKKCYHCHGPDEGSRKAKLRLDSFDDATQPRKDGAAIVPGKPAESLLVKRILAHDAEEVMPPPETKNALTAGEVALLQRWIAQGANYTPHWAWVKPQRPPLPPAGKAWAVNGIDRFVAAKLKANDLEPSPVADRPTLVRRLSLDLTGLPPTPEEADAFVNDRRSDAYERLVDRLLASPHFGERWARVWLDLGRYADSAGYGSDPLRPNIWPWRDWLIQALNRNQPFDEFTRDLIAGDLLPNATEEQKIATAFHRNTMTNTEGGTDDEEWRVAAVKDRAAVTAQVWMGLTMGCAQCHTHKFDPISHHDYYSFYAFFNQSEDNDQPDERPTLPVYSPAEKQRRSALQAEIAGLEQQFQANPPEFTRELAAWAENAARPVSWTTLNPISATSMLTNGAQLKSEADASVFASGPTPVRDTYVVKAVADLARATALRLEVLPDDRLRQKGPGRSGQGQFVLNDLRVEVAPARPQPVAARFVRVEAPGPKRFLSLAEVQVFSAGQNVAPKGTPSQSSTDYLGDANRAVDGNTDGNYDSARSTTHTRQENDPWWELDLGTALPVETVALWNRTDGSGERLANSRVKLLDANRTVVWETKIETAPAPVAKVGPAAPRAVKLAFASADYAQPEFGPELAIDSNPGQRSGWAVGGALGQPHTLIAEFAEPLKANGPLNLTVTLAHNYGDGHTLGRFRLSLTDRALPVRSFPAPVASALAQPAAERNATQQQALVDYFRPLSATLGPIARQVAAKRKELEAVRGTPVPVVREVATAQRRTTRILNKGNFLDPGAPVTAAVPTEFPPLPAGAGPDRLGLAAWLTAPENPLTARVAVNRFWGLLLGQPLVETEEDFGTQGTLPTNPELLDWLAVSFQSRTPRKAASTDPWAPALGWDFKGLLRLIVLSATYRQSSVTTPDQLAKDPLNRFYSHAPRRRLDAESLRDQALALSGLLARKVGGPSVYPLQPDGLWRAAFNGERSWATNEGEDRYRRGLYTFWRRTVPYPSMATFDAPSRESCTVRRQPTNTPLQAFVTLNDPTFVECAQALGRRLSQTEGSVADRLRRGLQWVTGRPADAKQTARLLGLFETEHAGFAADPEAATRLATQPLGPLPPGLSAAEAAAWTTIGNVLLNLDAVLTKG